MCVLPQTAHELALRARSRGPCTTVSARRRAGECPAGVTLGHELGRLSLSDSFALLLLFAEHDAERFKRAAPRWHARFVFAAGTLSIQEAQATLAALALIRGPHRQVALELLGRICREHGRRSTGELD